MIQGQESSLIADLVVVSFHSLTYLASPPLLLIL
jgi:hypothetical protein